MRRENGCNVTEHRCVATKSRCDARVNPVQEGRYDGEGWQIVSGVGQREREHVYTFSGASSSSSSSSSSAPLGSGSLVHRWLNCSLKSSIDGSRRIDGSAAGWARTVLWAAWHSYRDVFHLYFKFTHQECLSGDFQIVRI